MAGLAHRRHRPDRGTVHAGGRSGGPHPRRRRRRRSTSPSTCPRSSTAASSEFGGAATTSTSTSTSIGWQVYGDEAGLSRAVLNLLDNAAKWSPPGGRVGVRLSQVDPMHAELVVSDQGPGIPPQERDAGLRAVLPVDVGAGDARLRPRPGDRQTGRRETRWDTSDRRHRRRVATRRARRSTWCCRAGRCRRRRPTGSRHARAVRWTGRPAAPRMGDLGEDLREVWASPECSLSGFSAQGGTVGARLSLSLTDR